MIDRTLSHPGQQLRHRHLEAFCDYLKSSEAGFPLAAFQVRKKATIHAQMDSQICLCHASLKSQLAEPLTKSNADVTASSGHSSIMAVGFNRRVGLALHA